MLNESVTSVGVPGVTALGRQAAGRGSFFWHWTHAPARALFLLMLVVPTVFQAPKAVLLGGVVLLVLANAAVGRGAAVHRAVVLWVLVVVAVGLLFMLRGAVRGEPGALRVGTVYVLWPAVFGLLISAAPRRADVEGFVRLLVPATLLVSLLGLGLILEKAGYLPGAWFSSLPGDQGVGLHEGFVELRFGGLGTLVFCMPFLLATLACGPVRRPWLWGTLALGLLLVVLSGRRALMLLVALSPVLILPFVLCLPAGERTRVLSTALRVMGLAALAGVLVLAVVGRRAGIELDAVWQMFSTGFDSAQSESMSIRALQLREIMASWADSPLLGSGHGSFLPNHIRDLDRPWAYEQSYAALLFQTGVLGCLVYGVLVLWLFGCIVAIIRRGGSHATAMIPVAVGLSAFLIANATNPYLQKFDFMWVLFLPLALVNAWLLDRGQSSQAVPTSGG